MSVAQSEKKHRKKKASRNCCLFALVLPFGCEKSKKAKAKKAVEESEPTAVVRASCVLAGTAGVSGVVSFEQAAEGGLTRIAGTIKGLKPGKHGFHIHQFGDLSDGCVTAGPHFNPFNKTHGAFEDEDRHLGDLGNIMADKNGVAQIKLECNLVSLVGEHSVLGRSVIVHADEDDLGKGGHELSLTTGNAGARLACGVIGLAEAKKEAPKDAAAAHAEHGHSH